MNRIFSALLVVAALLPLGANAQTPPAKPAPAAAAGALRVGVGKVEITPTALTKLEPLTGGDFVGIHDPIYARAVVVDNGSTTIAMVAVETIHLLDTMPLRQRIQRELGIPADHIIITATHDHSAPQLIGAGPFWQPVVPEQAAYATATNEKIVEALKQAKASMQPARMGLGAGALDINVNRDQYAPGRGYAGQYNPKGPSDKTVWVVRFDSLSGKPIAILFNYAVHSDVTLGANLVTGDLVGVAAHVIEHNYDDKAVALFTMGGGGDQDARYKGNGKLLEPRAPAAGAARAAPPAVPATASPPATAAGGPALGPNGRPRPQPTREDLAERASEVFPAIDAQGYMLGSEVLRVASQIDAKIASPRIATAETEITCPVQADKHHDPYTFQDFSDGVPIRMGVLLVDQTAFAWVSGEVVENIHARLKAATPLADTILVTLANGRSGYLVDDQGYDMATLETRAATAAKGCAEAGIVNGLTDLIRTTSSVPQPPQPAR